MEEKEKIVVVDICHTLYNSNTTFDFFKYCIEAGKFSLFDKVYFKALLSKFSPIYWMVAVSEKIFKKDFLKALTVKLLASQDVGNVEDWAEEFFHQHLKPRAIAPTMSILKSFKPSEIILISATLEPIARVIAKNLNIKSYLSTELEIKDNKYTGKIINELSGKKLEALYALKKERVLIDVVITDNFTDKTLMATADYKYAVCYNKKQELFWSSLAKVNILQVELS